MSDYNFTEQERDTIELVFASKSLGLPLPRLQLTWAKIDPNNWFCRYDLLIPTREHDGRNEAGHGFTFAPVGGTRVGTESLPDKWGKIDTPFRDGAHIRWDSERLGMRAFVVYSDKYEELFLTPNDKQR